MPAPVRASLAPDPPRWGEPLRVRVEPGPAPGPQAVEVAVRATRRVRRPLAVGRTGLYVLFERAVTVQVRPREAAGQAEIALPPPADVPFLRALDEPPALVRLIARWLGVRIEPLTWSVEAHRIGRRTRRAS